MFFLDLCIRVKVVYFWGKVSNFTTQPKIRSRLEFSKLLCFQGDSRENKSYSRFQVCQVHSAIDKVVGTVQEPCLYYFIKLEYAVYIDVQSICISLDPTAGRSEHTAVAFLGPRFPTFVVAVAFPKTQFGCFCKLQAINPFGAFPSIEVWDYQPHRATVVWG